MKQILVKYDAGWYEDELIQCIDCKFMDWLVGGCCTHPKSPWKKTVVDPYDFCSKGEKEE